MVEQHEAYGGRSHVKLLMVPPGDGDICHQQANWIVKSELEMITVLICEDYPEERAPGSGYSG